LLRTVNLGRTKRILTLLAVVYAVLLSTATWVSASHRTHYSDDFSYRTRLKHDLDGDHIPETATVRERPHVYQVSIHFTTGRPKLRLTTYLTAGTAGLSLQTIDADNDSQGEFLVIISATSVRPVAVWANEGENFTQVNSWSYGGVGRYRGPTVQHQPTEAPDPIGASPNPPLQATLASRLFTAVADSAVLIHSQTDQFPFDSIFWQDPSRGPPAPSRV
jgi:hypothetical protein